MKWFYLWLALAGIFLSPVHAGGEQSGGRDMGGQAGHGGHVSVVGEPASPADVNRVIHVSLLDTMRFDFDQPIDNIRRGDVVQFIVTNRGQLPHEFSIGNKAEQDAHRAMMREMPGMEHDDPNAVTVAPSGTKFLIWRFAGTEPVVFACNIPGHAEAGMIATSSLGD